MGGVRKTSPRASEGHSRSYPRPRGNAKRRTDDGTDGMTDQERFRQVMGHFATGVAVVTGRDGDGQTLGFTANAVVSVSLDPLLVLVGVDHASSSLPALRESGVFALSFLGASQKGLARRFAAETRAERFAGVPIRTEETGAPILEEALAWLDCRVWKEVEAGDHLLLIGEVERCGGGEGEEPLVFYRGAYGTVCP